mgnify:CR=1 FL=1
MPVYVAGTVPHSTPTVTIASVPISVTVPPSTAVVVVIVPVVGDVTVGGVVLAAKMILLDSKVKAPSKSNSGCFVLSMTDYPEINVGLIVGWVDRVLG